MFVKQRQRSLGLLDSDQFLCAFAGVMLVML